MNTYRNPYSSFMLHTPSFIFYAILTRSRYWKILSAS